MLLLFIESSNTISRVLEELQNLQWKPLHALTTHFLEPGSLSNSFLTEYLGVAFNFDGTCAMFPIQHIIQPFQYLCHPKMDTEAWYFFKATFSWPRAHAVAWCHSAVMCFAQVTFDSTVRRFLSITSGLHLLRCRQNANQAPHFQQHLQSLHACKRSQLNWHALVCFAYLRLGAATMHCARS